MSRRQRTIAHEAEIEGRGLFTGQPARLLLKPAPPDTGLVFTRTDLGPDVRIEANVASVVKRFQRTSLANGDVTVETTEHLLSALAGLQIDNVCAELDGSELPAGDGSAADFVRLLRDAEIVEQEAERGRIVLADAITVQDGESVIAALPGPADELHLTYYLDYGPESPIPAQTYTVRLTPDVYVQELAASRTFIFEEEVEQLRRRGYGEGVTYQDLVVFGPDGPIGNPLRFPDEPARHKLVDLVGDLFLLGRDVCGRIVADRSGHHLSHRLVQRLRDQELGGPQAQARPALDILEIMEALPHRYPFLLVDRVLEIEGDRRAVGLKNVSINEHFFQGHYPGTPIMPGVLMVEAMAQLAGVLLLRNLEHSDKVAVLLSMDRVKMRKGVHPGDQLRLEAEVIRSRPTRAEVQTRAWVADDLAAEARLRFMLIAADQEY